MAEERVQIPAYTDRWMMGDRYGTLVKVATRRYWQGSEQPIEVAYVRLDKSGKTFCVPLDDCKFL